MIINNTYIINRINTLIGENKQKNSYFEKSHNIKKQIPEPLRDWLFPAPKWIKSTIFHPLNPFYFSYLQYRHLKKRKNLKIPVLHKFATDFMQYYLDKNLSFDTDLYYPAEDVHDFVEIIDNHIKSVIAGCQSYKLKEEQLEKIQTLKEMVSSARKSKNGFYKLSIEGITYFLPDKYLYEEHTYIHDYGLKLLPEYVKDYIKGKDFLDIGAFIGDTSILLAKKYQPHKIFAYEPFEQNFETLKKVIKVNELENIIDCEAKGISDKESEIDIFINPIHPSGCTTNEKYSFDKHSKSKITTSTIDNECLHRKIGLIKIDIEGAEYSAISGAIETIKRDKPVLLISVYHTAKDFYELPPLLKSIVPDYSFRFTSLESENPLTERILIAYPSNQSNF